MTGVHRFGRANRGTSAVEFALVAPVLILFVFGTICFSTIFTIANGLQQLAAEAARASVAGLSDSERGQLAQSFITANVGAYPFLRSRQLMVSTGGLTTPAAAFQVSLSYDLSAQVGSVFGGLLPISVTRLQRSAVILTGSSL